jgi:hypothetical protein
MEQIAAPRELRNRKRKEIVIRTRFFPGKFNNDEIWTLSKSQFSNQGVNK